MNQDQEEKSRFVSMFLKPLLVAATDGDVHDVTYQVEGCEEFVTIIHPNGYTRRACVTCDSLTTVVQDTLKLM